jgi:hypothetical protein
MTPVGTLTCDDHAESKCGVSCRDRFIVLEIETPPTTVVTAASVRGVQNRRVIPRMPRLRPLSILFLG